MKKLPILFIILLLLSTHALGASFPEIWGYLYAGEERFFPVDAPITDVACFSATINGDGELDNKLQAPPPLKGARRELRYHLVITIPWNKTLTHIYLNKKLPVRNRIIDSILTRSEGFDGVQIDFEAIDSADSMDYIDFIATLKQQLPSNKILSVAVMARWDEFLQNRPEDPYNYALISRFADRVVVMAYDEHYASGSPGPIASLSWCKKVYEHANQTVPAQKLIMGLPLYGRSWSSKRLARSLKNNQIQEELKARKLVPIIKPTTGGVYSYSETVDVYAYYETMESLETKIAHYITHPIQGIACWRIGQEPAGFWNSHFLK